MLCTVKDIKDRLGLTDEQTDHDAVIAQIIAGFTSLADRMTNRVLLATEEDVLEYYTGGTALLQVRRYPILTITSVKESETGDFDEAAALIEGDDWRLVSKGLSGVIRRLWGLWSPEIDGIQIVYRGGYAAAGAEEQEDGLPDGEIAMPADLREAAIKQCSMEFQRRDDLGISGTTFEGGGFNKFTDMQMLPVVRDVLESYRRIQI
jgi:hypothetical protein